VGDPVPHGDGGEQVGDDDDDVERLQMHRSPSLWEPSGAV
jgi:hypothetical protein